MLARNIFSALAMLAVLGFAAAPTYADETADEMVQRLKETANQGSPIGDEEARLPDHILETIATN